MVTIRVWHYVYWSDIIGVLSSVISGQSGHVCSRSNEQSTNVYLSTAQFLSDKSKLLAELC